MYREDTCGGETQGSLLTTDATLYSNYPQEPSVKVPFYLSGIIQGSLTTLYTALIVSTMCIAKAAPNRTVSTASFWNKATHLFNLVTERALPLLFVHDVGMPADDVYRRTLRAALAQYWYYTLL